MTTIIFSKDKDGSYKQLICQGHAGFRRAGKDIVCAAVSALVINTTNAMEELVGEQFSCVTNQKDGFMRFDFETPLQEKSILLMDALVLGLTNIQKEYGNKYLQVKFEEV